MKGPNGTSGIAKRMAYFIVAASGDGTRHHEGIECDIVAIILYVAAFLKSQNSNLV